jgi:hypothetical protein
LKSRSRAETQFLRIHARSPDRGGRGSGRPDLDEVRIKLAEIQQLLDDLPDDAFGERISLRERRRELQALAGELREGNRTPEHLKKELDDLRRLRDDVFDRHLSIGNIGGGGGPGGGGIDVEYVNEVNRTIDAAWDRAKIDRRIKELETKLARLPR